MTCVFDCIGGFAPVNDAYIDTELRKLPQTLNPDARSDLRTRIRDSVYPCPSCRPEQYELWRGGHFAPDHTCDECKARRATRRRAS